MAHVLVVEDNKTIASLVRKEIESNLEFEVSWAPTYADTARLLDDGSRKFIVALLDLNLPDAPRGEIVDLVLSRNVPSIVFTGEFSDQVRNIMWSKKVVDYVLKESAHSIDYVVSLVRRVYRNRFIKAVVVDDSEIYRQSVCDLLRIHQYRVLEASDGEEALEILKENQNIKLVVTDYNMPNMDGFQLTKEIRRKFRKDELAIIGMSAASDDLLSAKFIKSGANDFIRKPFLIEEFYCRISQNMEMIEYIKAIKDSMNKDYLTGLSNRRYLFDVGNNIYKNSRRGNITMVVGLIDIDHFKRINDTYGHDIGDKVLKNVSLILNSRFRDTDIVARFGGEEFCILAANMDHGHVFHIFDDLRKSIEQAEVDINNNKIKVTVSMGICTTLRGSLEEMIKEADVMLYRAKSEGRNKVVLAS